MKKNTKVAISLPVDMYENIEKARVKKGESRSEYFRHAIEKMLKEEQNARDIQVYVTSYAADPETGAERKGVDRLSAAILARESW
jgi:metal-responsive CopG/Arc/MetJ family transcriptional regulator